MAVPGNIPALCSRPLRHYDGVDFTEELNRTTAHTIWLSPVQNAPENIVSVNLEADVRVGDVIEIEHLPQSMD